jgi:hypothetical protein
MEQLLGVYTTARYNEEIEQMVEETKMSYLDTILHHADQNNLESETIAKLISANLKMKLRVEAESLHFLPKIAKLPI